MVCQCIAMYSFDLSSLFSLRDFSSVFSVWFLGWFFMISGKERMVLKCGPPTAWVICHTPSLLLATSLGNGNLSLDLSRLFFHFEKTTKYMEVKKSKASCLLWTLNSPRNTFLDFHSWVWKQPLVAQNITRLCRSHPRCQLFIIQVDCLRQIGWIFGKTPRGEGGCHFRSKTNCSRFVVF